MSKQLIVRLDEGELKVYTPEAGKEWSSIKRSDVLEEIKKEIKSLGVNTEAGKGGSSIKQSEVEQMVEEKIRLMGLNPGTEGVHPWNQEQTLPEGTRAILGYNGEPNKKKDLGGRRIEYDIV